MPSCLVSLRRGGRLELVKWRKKLALRGVGWAGGWDELAKTHLRDEMWKVNEKFLDIEIASGRDIYLSHDPAKFSGDGSFFAKEIEYLRQHGYKFVKEGDLWHAVQ